MPAHDNTSRPPAAAGDRGRQTAAADSDAQLTPAQAYVTAAAQRADELHRSAAALLQRADALLASSNRRLTPS